MMAETSHTSRSGMTKVVIVLVGAVLFLNLQLLFLYPDSRKQNTDVHSGCTRQVIINFYDQNQMNSSSHESLLKKWNESKEGKSLGLYRNEESVLTIGIPVNKWPGGQASLLHTLGSLSNNTSLHEKLEITVCVVLWSEDDTFNHQLVEAILKEYEYFIRIGFIKIIHPDVSWVPGIATLQNTSLLVDGDLKMIQFMAGKCRSLYYLHLSDDVICAPNFYQQIKRYLSEVVEPWKMLEFSELGYIGKLVPVDLLPKWAVFMSMFSSDTDPLDKIFFYFRQTVLQRKKIMMKPTLFQRNSYKEWNSMGDENHEGKHDRFFDDGSLYLQGDDPEGEVLSNMLPVGQNTPEFAYRAGPQHFFWAQSPKAGDWLVIVFENDVDIDRVVVRTGFESEGLESNLMDKLHNATVEISPRLLQMDVKKNKVTCASYRKIGVVGNGYADLQNKYHHRLTKCLKITVIEEESERVVFQQISVTVNKNKLPDI